MTFAQNQNTTMDVEHSDMPSLKSLLQLKKKYDAPVPEDLGPGYKSNTDKEKLYLWAADNFKKQVKFNDYAKSQQTYFHLFFRLGSIFRSSSLYASYAKTNVMSISTFLPS